MTLLTAFVPILMVSSISAWDRNQYIRQYHQQGGAGERFGGGSRLRGLRTGEVDLPAKKNSIKDGMSKIGSSAPSSTGGGKYLGGVAAPATSKGAAPGIGHQKNMMNGYHGGMNGGDGKGGMGGGSGGDCAYISVAFLQEEVPDYYTEDQIGGGMIVSGLNR